MVLCVVGCAGTRPAQERGPTDVGLPAPGFTPVFFQDSRIPPSARASERDRCIDAEIERRDLNEFGDPKGTVYREGTPVGVKSAADRYEYALRHNPDIGTRCMRAPGEPDL